ncbi:MAG: tetratricopeptide repeat protein, partial [Robiginitomaculum sp.]
MSYFRRRLSCFMLLATTCFLTACTTADGGARYYSDATTPEGELLGDYLAGRYAYHIDDSAARLKYYQSAFERAPDSAALGAKAVNAAISAGDGPLARTLAKRVLAVQSDEALSRLVLSAQSISGGKYSAAAQRLHDQPEDPSLGVMMAMMEGWALYGAGESDKAIEVFNAIEVGGYFDVVATLQKAQIYAASGDESQAKAGFDLVEKTGVSPISMALAKARYLSNKGDFASALSFLKAFDEDTLGGVESGPVRTALDALEAGNRPSGKLNAAQLASSSLVDPAGEFFYQQRAYDAAEMYLRTALMMDPKNQRARLWLAATLERMERTQDAQKIYKEIPKDSDYYVSATLSYANLLSRDDQDAKSTAVLKSLNKSHPTFLTRQAIGLSYLIAEDYEKALPYFDTMVKSMSEAELKDNPQPLYHRGICLEQAGRWQEAVSDFKRVLEVNPESADTLNYLGYTWVDKGENLTEAFEMIR